MSGVIPVFQINLVLINYEKHLHILLSFNISSIIKPISTPLKDYFTDSPLLLTHLHLMKHLDEQPHLN